MCVILGWRLHIELAALSPFEARLRDTFQHSDSAVASLPPSSESVPEPMYGSSAIPSESPDGARASTSCVSSSSSPIVAPPRASRRTSSQAPLDPPSSTGCTSFRTSTSPGGGELGTQAHAPPCSVLPSSSRSLMSLNGPPVSSGTSLSHSSLASLPNSSALSSADGVSSPSLSANALASSPEQPRPLVDVRGCCVSKAGSPTIVSDPDTVAHDRVVGRLGPAFW